MDDRRMSRHSIGGCATKIIISLNPNTKLCTCFLYLEIKRPKGGGAESMTNISIYFSTNSTKKREM